MRWDKRITLNSHQYFIIRSEAFQWGVPEKKRGGSAFQERRLSTTDHRMARYPHISAGCRRLRFSARCLGRRCTPPVLPPGKGAFPQGSGTALLPGFDRSTSGGIAGNCAPERNGPRSSSDRVPGSGGDLPSPSGGVGRAAARSTWSPERVASRSAWTAAGSQASGKQAPLCKISDIF